MQEPPTVREPPRRRQLFGIDLVDEFHWLREVGSPQVLRHLEGENASTDRALAHTAALREQLRDELMARLQEDDEGVPVRRGGNLYYWRTRRGRQYRIYCRRPVGDAGAEQILLDANLLADGYRFFRLGIFEISPDQRFLAFSIDTRGDESFVLRVKDLESGRILPDRLEGTYYTLAWANDSRSFFYTRLDPKLRPHRVYRHILGEEAERDSLVLEESDETYFLEVSRSRSRRYIFVRLQSAVTSEVWFLDADRPEGPPRVVRSRTPGVEYSVDHHGDWLYLLTNDGAREFELRRCPVASCADPGSDQVVLGHRPEVRLQSVDLFARHLVVVERCDVLRRIRVRSLVDGAEELVELPESLYTIWRGENPEWETPAFRFGYSSLATPPTVYDYRFADGGLEMLKRDEVPGYQPERYEIARLRAPAADGVEVPISVVRRRSTARRGPAPTLLYGYGAYGATLEAAFSAHRLALLDRGFVFAIAHVRGGGALGEAWHEQGRMLAKRNTFTDFITAAEQLVETGYAERGRLAIRGGSAGGLLIGAVLNMRPDLFAAAVANVPFVDVVNTMLDPSIPLTVTEYEEWGDPRQREYLEYILSYSPYDNVVAQDYPPILITAGLHDPRVQYWEPAKWAARLRARKTDSNPVLLKIEMGAGHSGRSGRYDALEERAMEYAFLLDSLGLAGDP